MSTKDLSADVSITISETGMQAVVESYTPASPDAPPLSAETLTKRMREAGIIGSDTPYAEKILLKARLGKDISGMTVLAGRPPQEPRDAEIEFLGDMAYPVLHDEAFARLTPAQKPAPGTTVTGTPVLPKSERKPEDIACEKNSGCILDEKTFEIRAARYGLVDYRQRKLSLKPLASVTPDGLLVTGTIYPLDFHEKPITVDMLKRELWAMGVRTMAQGSVKRAIAKAARTAAPVENVSLAKGRAPVHGSDGRFELLFTGEEDMPAADSLEAIDPRERSIFKPIGEGTPIGRLLPPGEGRFGQDVFGEDLVPRRGRPVEILAGDNVEVSADGVNFKAAISGMITWTGNRVSVLEMIHVTGDVSYATGNLRLDTGSVLIDGSVNDGFSVTAPGDICVGGAVESASLAAGGNIGVSGGLVMGGEGHLRAKGDVSFSFGENAVVEAGGNVDVAHHLSNSDVTTKGRLRCVRSKGVIMGGSVRAGLGVEANELGSEFGVKTSIILDPGFEVGGVRKLVVERKALREKKSQLDGILGTEPPKAVLLRTPPAKRGKIAELLKTRIAAVARLKEIETALTERREALERLQTLKVKVRGTAHPGTVVAIADKKMALNEPEGPCEFFYDPETENVVMRK